MKITPIKPTGITLIATLRCSAACDNCCFGCNPAQGRSMTYDQMQSYVDMSLEAYPDSINRFSLTGGECMLLKKDVGRILSYCSGKGLECFMVSNAYWATDYEKARKILRHLQRCGLNSVAFSTGEDHDKYVPWTNVRNAVAAAAHLGLSPELRYEDRPGRTAILQCLEADEQVGPLIKTHHIRVSKSTWMNFNNNGPKSRVWKIPFREHEGMGGCKSLFQDVIINPYGEVYACCGIGVCRIPQMRIGNVNREPIKAIYEHAFEDFLKIWLYMEGPNAVLKYVHEKTGQKKFNWHTSHNCDICRAIFTDGEIIPCIRENFYDAAYFPMMTYNSVAEKENEERSKRKETPHP